MSNVGATIWPKPFALEGVQLVKVEGMPFFIPTDDNIYTADDGTYKTTSRKISNLIEITNVSSESISSKAITLVMRQIQMEGFSSTNIFDIGAWVGFFGVIASRSALNHNLKPLCSYYDPSSAGFLISANISINNLGEFSQVYREALSKNSQEVIFVSEVGFSDNHRVDFGQTSDEKSIRYKVDSINLDHFLVRHPIARNTIIKLDLEGQDTEFLWEADLFRDAFLFFEFSPKQQLTRKFIDYGKLDEFMDNFHLWDIGESYKGAKFEKVLGSSFELVEKVLTFPHQYTDLLAIHKSRQLFL